MHKSILPYEIYKQYDSYQGNGQSALLQATKKSVSKTYSSTYIRADGQVLKVDFTDGISFEIVPCFINNNSSYTYPDTNDGGSWKVTNPKSEIQEINKGNKKWNSNLKPLCKMVRAWKEEWNVPIGGLLIDTLAYKFLSEWNYNDKSFIYYDWMSRDFFKMLKNQNEDQQYWYAIGSNQRVYHRGKFEYKALRCYNLTLDAIDNEKYESKSKKIWRQIYGSRFPN